METLASVRHPSEIENTHLREFLVETIHKSTKDITRIADLLRILTHNPDEGSPGIGFIQFVDALAESRDDSFVAGIFPEDVLNDHNRLLDDVVHLGVDQIQQSVHALLAGALDLDGDLTDGLDGASHKVHIDFQGVFLQFRQKLVDIALTGYPDHDLEFLELDVRWVVVLAEENAELLSEDVGLLLQQEVDVAQSDILDFRGGGDKGHWGAKHQQKSQAGGKTRVPYPGAEPSSSGRSGTVPA